MVSPIAGAAGSGLRITRKVDPRVVTVALCSAVIAFLAVEAWRRRWVADDAFIDLRVVANLHHGLGPVYNAGERVEAFTSPAWVALLWLASAIVSIAPLEWIAVVLGAVATLAATALAARGSWLLWQRRHPGGVGIPVGLLVVVAVPAVWDFATSGLETGITFFWLGGCFWLLAVLRTRAEAGRRRLRPRVTPQLAAVAIGLGPLVRPDLAIFSVGFLVALLVSPPLEGRAPRLRLAAWALAAPVAYQLFRMGYYAALEPNTALAKEAGAADWSRGWNYFKDFFDSYLLIVPLALLGLLGAFELRRGKRPSRPVLILALAPIVCAALHALYIVRVGGDFMHARMLLPDLFAATLPVAVVVPGRSRLRIACALAVAVWAVVCATSLRAPETTSRTALSGGLSDERLSYVFFSSNPHPITLRDYRRVPAEEAGTMLRKLAARRGALILHVPGLTARSYVVNAGLSPAGRTPVIAGALTIGLLGYAAGPRVHIVDEYGIADPLGARTELTAIVIPRSALAGPPAAQTGYLVLAKRGRAGHEKFLPTEWIAARFAPSEARLTGTQLAPVELAAARRALRCGAISRLLTAVTAPLTLDRFVSNVGASFSLTTLRFPARPSAAVRRVCP